MHTFMSMETISPPGACPNEIQLPPWYIDQQIGYMEEVLAPPDAAEAARLEWVSSLPAEGFASAEHQEVVGHIAAIGFPLDNFNNLSHRPNVGEEEHTLASWGVGTENYGEFTIYDLHHRQHPEERLRTIGHESMHANTPLDGKNAHLYGGEAERLEAVRFVEALAEQSLLTGKWLNGYHKSLAQKYNADKTAKNHAIFVEETSAITAELALSNRGHLRQVEDAQHKKMDDLTRAARAQGKPEPAPKVALLSSEGRDGSVRVEGIDRTLIKLLHGVDDYHSLMQRINSLKARFYPEESLTVAIERGTAGSMQTLPIEIMMQALNVEKDKPRTNKAKLKSKSKKTAEISRIKPKPYIVQAAGWLSLASAA